MKEKEFEKLVSGWLSEEQKTGKDVPTLNLIRALDPHALPTDFPSRQSFIGCSAHLSEWSMEKAAKKTDPSALSAAKTDWENCLQIVYSDGKPPEFESLRKCVDSATAESQR